MRYKAGHEPAKTLPPRRRRALHGDGRVAPGAPPRTGGAPNHSYGTWRTRRARASSRPRGGRRGAAGRPPRLWRGDGGRRFARAHRPPLRGALWRGGRVRPRYGDHWLVRGFSSRLSRRLRRRRAHWSCPAGLSRIRQYSGGPRAKSRADRSWGGNALRADHGTDRGRASARAPRRFAAHEPSQSDRRDDTRRRNWKKSAPSARTPGLCWSATKSITGWSTKGAPRRRCAFREARSSSTPFQNITR